MADREEKREAEKADVTTPKGTTPWPLITIGIFATVVTVALVIVSWLFITSHQQTRTTAGLGYPGLGNGSQMFRRGDMRVGGAFQAAAARGVITAISGDSLTVSGGGKQVTVKKTSATAINGDKTSIAVNDTVIVIGDTASDGTITAIRITVRNEGIESVGTDSNVDRDTLPSA